MQQLSERLMSWASILEPGTRAQAEATASMPFIYPHVALMPDAHLGRGATVGSVIPTLGAVIPAAVGVDIGTARKRVGVLEDHAETADLNPDDYAKNWRKQLGSLGGGNHFIEVTADEQQRVWLFLHSGSRGVGNRIA